jgi:hypothetical protein
MTEMTEIKKFIKYMFQEGVPMKSTEEWDHRAIRAAGFCPSSPAIKLARLTADWNTHQEGALVVYEFMESGAQFAVEVL